MGGHVDVVATPVSTFSPVMGTGKLRIIAVAAPQRTSGQFAQAPTWREQGFDVVANGYRMIVAPRGVARAQLGFWNEALGQVSRSDAWKKELAANGWESLYMPAAETSSYLDGQYAQYRAILVELGLAK
jgi:putative tricarboxylic transport membrane protein